MTSGHFGFNSYVEISSYLNKRISKEFKMSVTDKMV